MLEVRGGTRRSAKRRRVEWTSSRSEEKHAHYTTADLEATRAEVLVRHAIAREVDDRPKDERRDPRPARSAHCCTGGDVERDDHLTRCSGWGEA